MHRATAVVVTVDQSIGHGFAEGTEIHLGHRHAEKADLQLFFRVIGAEVGFQPVQRLEQREAAELVEAHCLLGQHLKGEFVGGHQLAQRGFTADQQQAGEGRYTRTVRLARGKQQRAVEGLVV
ncbi:hypothetical protein FQZ97_641180 [compost metagenome]